MPHEPPFKPTAEPYRQRVDAVRIKPLLRVSMLAFLLLLLSLLVAGVVAWWIARSMGSLGALEAFVAEAFALDTFTLPSGYILAAWVGIATFASLLTSLFLTLLALIYNRVAQLVGGIELDTVGVRVPRVGVPDPGQPARS